MRVRLAGVCSTDLELLRGYYPFQGIPGHEFIGEVIDAPGHPEWVSRRVVGEINLVCGECGSCLAGRPSHCEQRKVLGIRGVHGAFAEYLILPVHNLHQVPDAVPDEAAVFTEPIAAAYEILEQVPVDPAQRVLVVGAGRLGQLIAQVLATTGCDLSVVARHPYQQQLLEQHHIRWIKEDEVKAGAADVVVEATGSPEGYHLARQAIRPRGTLVLKSTYQGDLTVNFSSLVVDEITLVGSRCGPFPPAIDLLAHKRVDPRGLIQACYPLVKGKQALELAAQPGALKILINPWIDEIWTTEAALP